MFFSGWESLGRTVVASVLAYSGLILLLRISGKRTLSKLNAFDLVVTVALGSTLATVIVSKEVVLAEGFAALALLILGQFLVTWLSVRSGTVRRVMRAEPTLLYYRGEFLDRPMRSQRVTESEIHQVARSQGIAELNQHSVVLETDGSFSILPFSDKGDGPLAEDSPSNRG